jgi:hypothetical protein
MAENASHKASSRQCCESRTRYPLDTNVEVYQILALILVIGVRDLVIQNKYNYMCRLLDRLCGLVVRVLGYRSRGPSSIPGTTRFSEM